MLRAEFMPIIIVNKIAIVNLEYYPHSKVSLHFYLLIQVSCSLLLAIEIELSIIGMTEAGIGVRIVGWQMQS